MKNTVQTIVIAGGGTAGWTAAAAIAKQMGPTVNLILVESDDIGTVGVGEATIPPMRVFHKLLGINEQDFMRATSATFKLGIQFENWGQKGDTYIHSFGLTGRESFVAPFHHFWLYGKEQGFAKEFGKYCFELEAAKQDKFATSEKANVQFAYHLDSSQYAVLLRNYSESRGVVRKEGKIKQVKQDPTSGFIQSIVLESGEEIAGDFFIDCTGFRGLLIEETLKTGYQDWSHWLPCDSAVAVQTESVGAPRPITRAIAHDSGWQWQIPLQHRVGNGLVYCSQYMPDEEAIPFLLNEVSGTPITQPKVIKFKTGRRLKAWNKNCLALGLSSGFVEPLESTSIHLIMMGIIRFLKLFPNGVVNQTIEDEYNRQTIDEITKIRDFIILHYHATARQDTPFWQYCHDMQVPETLKHRMQLFEEFGHAFQEDGELFRVDSWTQVMLGQGIMPKNFHASVRGMPVTELQRFLQGIEMSIEKNVQTMPSHQAFINAYCRK
ncbi:tryptophan halogenase family protein [Glaciecola sp. 1036]|uniref:tryptophan halogenase family protein n=1 Tax=Alteromonadaceae TaxID=72275 RepID=UPI003D00E362